MVQEDDISNALRKRLEADLAEIRKEYEEKFEASLDETKRRFEERVKSRIITIASAAIAAIVLVVAVAAVTATKDVNTSVISLQGEIISAQTVIRTSTKELDDAKSNLVKVTSELESAAQKLNDTRKRTKNGS